MSEIPKHPAQERSFLGKAIEKIIGEDTLLNKHSSFVIPQLRRVLLGRDETSDADLESSTKKSKRATKSVEEALKHTLDSVKVTEYDDDQAERILAAARAKITRNAKVDAAPPAPPTSPDLPDDTDLHKKEVKALESHPVRTFLEGSDDEVLRVGTVEVKRKDVDPKLAEKILQLLDSGYFHNSVEEAQEAGYQPLDFLPIPQTLSLADRMLLACIIPVFGITTHKDYSSLNDLKRGEDYLVPQEMRLFVLNIIQHRQAVLQDGTQSSYVGLTSVVHAQGAMLFNSDKRSYDIHL